MQTVFLVTALALSVWTPQEFDERLPVSFSQPLISRTEAYIGEPFGVGMITFRLPPDGGDVNSSLVLQSGATKLSERNNRVIYQVVGQQAAARAIGQLVGRSDVPTDQKYAIWFLFKGKDKLELTLHGSDAKRITIEPTVVRRRNQFKRRIDQWWREYNRVADQQGKQGDYPNLIESYLTTMLGLRLGMPIAPRPKDRRDPLAKTFDLMFNVEGLRSEMIRDAMLGHVDIGERHRVVPPTIFWDDDPIPPVVGEAEVERIANYIPEECFYLRFGTWKNQIWLKKLMEEYGGDLGRMFSLRGYESRVNARFLDQLALESSELDEMFGASVIRDVAVIGMDTYFDDGPAVGVLLHAKGTESLKKRISGRRKNFAKRNKDISIVEVEIGGQTASFLSTPNNQHRSFHIVKDDFHLITNCRKIAERFLEAANGVDSLGQTDEFRYARSEMPLDTNHTIFVYLSRKFFKNQLHPRNQIELRRRNNAIADMQLMQMASLAAAGEGHNITSPEFLVEQGFLPEYFALAEKHSRYELVDNVWTDSVRGARGFFLPVPDAEINAITDFEHRWFAERADYFSENVSQLEPMYVGIKRFEKDTNVERVVFDARLAPFGSEKFGWVNQMLGPPMEREVIGSPDDIIRFEASIGQGLLNPNIKPHQIFAAVQDHLDPRLDLRPKSFVDTYQTFRETPGYLGAWPAPGALDWMPNLGGQPDPEGYTYSRMLKLWRLQWQDYSVLSYDRQRLDELKPHLATRPVKRPAHLRVKVGNLADSKLRRWANTLNYRRSWQTSLANIRMLNALMNQFRLSPQQARQVAEQMLDVKLVCSLGGEYQLCQTREGREVWCSSAWPNFLNPSLPDDYVAPVLGWFRGLEMEVTQAESQFAVYGYLDLQRADDGSVLPSLDIFKGFGSLLQGSGEKEKPKSEKDPAPKAPDPNRNPNSILEKIK